ncbi:MAG: hypothetical protein PHH28_08280, partial [Desulfuromonadaceae bacterium]|nr:hypothetical protein [Desulfuromonadaceae bacterium]
MVIENEKVSPGQDDTVVNGHGSEEVHQVTGHLFSRENARKRKKVILVMLITLLAVGGGSYWWHSTFWESTDDAQIDGHINPISARVRGHVARLDFKDYQYVAAG